MLKMVFRISYIDPKTGLEYVLNYPNVLRKVWVDKIVELLNMGIDFKEETL